jgi:glutamyl-tRNA(Gln) amidotransferase subunit E
LSDSKPQNDTLEFKAIGLKVGLEVHQQLATREKLFCDCPVSTPASSTKPLILKSETIDGDFPIQFTRVLRASRSELGEVDAAAQFEALRESRIRYYCNDASSCLVEVDEEPPHELNQEALQTSLIFALALGSRIVDEMHVMRKIVVDGSNTSGFQRTLVIALNGALVYNSGKSSVKVQGVSLEEDAARALVPESRSSTEREDKAYILDRLGIPLVEVALAPIEGTPEDVREAAGVLGRLMRSTGRIARGLGTIRQDLNISVLNGNVIEVKGVQRLDQIPKVVTYESARQVFFVRLAKEIEEKIGRNIDVSTFDVTNVFVNTKSDVLKHSLSDLHKPEIRCIVAKKFAGYIGRENSFGSRLGKELGSIARSYGLGGVIHSDELPKYGITVEEIQRVRVAANSTKSDAFVLLSGERSKVEACINTLISRLRFATIGVPAETRVATPENETAFLRPRPGSARMYPETDIPLIRISKQEIESLRRFVPEPWDALVAKFASEYDLPRHLAERLYDSDYRSLFERVISRTKLGPRLVASVLIDTLQSLTREGFAVDQIQERSLEEIFHSLDNGDFAKEALPKILSFFADEPLLSIRNALQKAGLHAIGEGELTRIVDGAIRDNRELISSKGMAGQSTLIGRVMQQVRGKADGKIVSKIVSERLKAYLETARD